MWRKSEIVQPEISVTNPSIVIPKQNVETYAGAKILVTSSTTNLEKIKNYSSYFNSFNGENDEETVTIDNIRVKFYSKKSFSNYFFEFASFTPTSETDGYFTLTEQYGESTYPTSKDLTASFNGKKILQPLKTTPLGFVLGNKLDQYPQNGQQGNYWYELIGQINSANVYSLNEKLLTDIKNNTVTEIKQEVQNG